MKVHGVEPAAAPPGSLTAPSASHALITAVAGRPETIPLALTERMPAVWTSPGSASVNVISPFAEAFAVEPVNAASSLSAALALVAGSISGASLTAVTVRRKRSAAVNAPSLATISISSEPLKLVGAVPVKRPLAYVSQLGSAAPPNSRADSVSVAESTSAKVVAGIAISTLPSSATVTSGSASATYGASLTGSMTRLNARVVLNWPSLAVSSSAMVPLKSSGGVPLIRRVAESNASHVGSAAPAVLRRLSVSGSPSGSVAVPAARMMLTVISSSEWSGAIAPITGAWFDATTLTATVVVLVSAPSLSV